MTTIFLESDSLAEWQWNRIAKLTRTFRESQSPSLTQANFANQLTYAVQLVAQETAESGLVENTHCYHKADISRLEAWAKPTSWRARNLTNVPRTYELEGLARLLGMREL